APDVGSLGYGARIRRCVGGAVNSDRPAPRSHRVRARVFLRCASRQVRIHRARVGRGRRVAIVWYSAGAGQLLRAEPETFVEPGSKLAAAWPANNGRALQSPF